MRDKTSTRGYDAGAGSGVWWTVRGGGIDREEGAAALEFAIVGTLLMLLVFGAIEFGLWIFQYENFASAAREGARVAAVQQDINGGGFDATDIADAVAEAAAPYDEDIGPGTPAADKDCSVSENVGTLVTVEWQQDFQVPNLFALLPLLPDNPVTVKGVFRCE
jgi:Flp pilus assembly protein TadG